MKKIIRIFKLAENNKRYFLVSLILILFFLISRSFPAIVVTSKNCEGGKCKAVVKAPNLTDKKPRYYVNNIFNSQKNEFYRIIFEAKSNKPTSLDVLATNSLDENKNIKKVEINDVNIYQTNEAYFASDKIYTDLLFEKNNHQDGADVAIGHIYISRLNVGSEREIHSLLPTITGSADMEILDQRQEKNDFSFEQLKEPEVFFGQVFQAELNYITGVEMDIDIIKQSNMGDKKYSLELREVEDEGTVPDIKSDPLAMVKFSIDGIEEYRQENGKFLFPIVSKLEKGKKYFIGINNDNVRTNKFNYLIIKGTKSGDAYSQGSATVKYKKNSYLAQGDIYFKTFGFKLKKYENKDVMPGTVIEDKGNGQLFFSYWQKNNRYKLINPDSFSKDIYFDEDKGYLAGKINDKWDSFIIYKFDTIFPFRNFSFLATQGDTDLNKMKVYFSFDNENWQEMPAEIKNNLQVWSYFKSGIPVSQREIYFKIEPEKDKYPQEIGFGIRDIKFQAELVGKK